MALKQTWFDRMASQVAPRWYLKRTRARLQTELALRNYEGASVGRRTQGWRRVSTDATQASGPFLGRLRDVARDLVRNNGYAESAVSTIVDHVVGWGIVPKPNPNNPAVRELWKRWAETTACDADGRHDFYGLQELALRTVIESGEVLIRRRLRFASDGLPIPMQLQVLEPDFLDTAKDSLTLNNGGARIVQGVEFDALGRRVAYWLFPEHPGSAFATASSVRVPAANVLHVFRQLRPGQVRGVSWFAPVLLKFKDADELDDAELMKQKIAACLAVITSDADGSNAPLGTTNNGETTPEIDSLEPGMILNVTPGRSIDVVQPPSVREYAEFAAITQRAIATGLGVTYEDLTGDYNDLPFSAARMSLLRHWARVERWRWKTIIPQLCDPVWAWFAETATIFGTNVGTAEWSAPPLPIVDPVNEGLAFQRNVRAGMMSLSEALRERGYDPETVLEEMAEDNKRLDKLGLILDSDPRQATQAGQLQGKALPKEPAPKPAAPATEEDEMEEAARRVRDEQRRLRRVVGGVR